MSSLLATLKFLNLLDEENRLSLTNIGLIILVGKMALSSQSDWTSVAATVAGFANYMHKRNVIFKSPGEE
jgi:hypothetical protein